MPAKPKRRRQPKPKTLLDWLDERIGAILYQVAGPGIFTPPFPDGQQFPPVDPAILADARLVIDAGRKSLAKTHHPDRAGDGGAKMAGVNRAADLLEMLVRELPKR